MSPAYAHGRRRVSDDQNATTSHQQSLIPDDLQISERLLIRLALTGVAFVSALVVIAGFLGQFHRAADSIAILRPLFGPVCLLGFWAARSPIPKAAFGALGLFALWTVAATFLPQAPGGHIRIYAKNLWAGNTEIQAVVDDIHDAGVDVVMLQEVSEHNDRVLDLLRGEFPHQHLCRFSAWSGIALASRHPFTAAPQCSSWRAVLAAPIDLNGEHVWVASIHIPWPWPEGMPESESAADEILSSLDGPVVMAGDFNIVPWSGRISRLAELTDTRLAGPAHITFNLRGLPLVLDMAMAPYGGHAEVRPLLGSDHAGIVADLAIWHRDSGGY